MLWVDFINTKIAKMSLFFNAFREKTPEEQAQINRKYISKKICESESLCVKLSDTIKKTSTPTGICNFNFSLKREIINNKEEINPFEIRFTFSWMSDLLNKYSIWYDCPIELINALGEKYIDTIKNEIVNPKFQEWSKNDKYRIKSLTR